MKISFGPWTIAPSQLFFESPLSFGLVNLKPLVQGHVLLIPKRCTPRFTELTSEEVSDLFASVQIVCRALEKAYPSSSDAFNIALQDGKHAGQSVPHVHVHVLPRKEKDFSNSDEVHKLIETQR